MHEEEKESQSSVHTTTRYLDHTFRELAKSITKINTRSINPYLQRTKVVIDARCRRSRLLRVNRPSLGEFQALFLLRHILVRNRALTGSEDQRVGDLAKHGSLVTGGQMQRLLLGVPLLGLSYGGILILRRVHGKRRESDSERWRGGGRC